MRKWRYCTFLHLDRRSPSLFRNKQFLKVSRSKAHMDGLQVAAMESVVLEIDIFVSSMGNFNFSKKKLKNNAFVGNTGHWTTR